MSRRPPPEPPQRWKRQSARRRARCGIFDLDRVGFDPPDGRPTQEFWVIEAPDWINVIPLTHDDRVLLIRQFRFGVDDFTWEIPGGMCDPGESPHAAARRELLEETGHEAREIIELGFVHPNPAIQNNRCWSYLARDVREIAAPTPDPNESFELTRVPLVDVPEWIRSGRITHALVVAAFQLLETGRRK